MVNVSQFEELFDKLQSLHVAVQLVECGLTDESYFFGEKPPE